MNAPGSDPIAIYRTEAPIYAEGEAHVGDRILDGAVCFQTRVCEDGRTASPAAVGAPAARRSSRALEPVQAEYTRLLQDEAYLDSVLAQSADQARTIAAATMERVRKAAGIGA